MDDYVPLFIRENPDRVLIRDQETDLPVITDADMFFTFCRDPHLPEQMRHELVETAAQGPMKRLTNLSGGPVSDLEWFTAACAVPGLTEDDLLLFAISIPNGPTRDLGDLTRLLLAHPACTDRVVCRLLDAAWCRRDMTGTPVKIPSVLAVLDGVEHPAAVAYRLTWSTARAEGAEDTADHESYLERTGRLRRLGPTAARAADRLAGEWAGTLDELLGTAADVALAPTR